MNHRNSKNSKRSNGVVNRKWNNGIVKCWSLGPHHSNTPPLHHSIPPTTPPLHHSIPPTAPSLRSPFSLIEFIGRLANIVLGCLSRRDSRKIARRSNPGNNLKGASPAAPALGRLARATSEFQAALRDASSARVRPGVEAPGYHRSSLRDRRTARRRTNCRNNERSVEAVNRW